MLNDSDCCPDMLLYCLSLYRIGWSNMCDSKCVTGLIQNTIICVNLAGSGGVIDWWHCNEPNVDIFSYFYFIYKGNTGTGEGVLQ